MIKRIIRKTLHSNPTTDDDKDRPVSHLPCGAQIYGQRLGHCPGAGCGFPGEGCCRNFWGLEAWDKHWHTVDGRKACHTDEELTDLGFVQDRPENAWRINTDTDTDPDRIEDEQ